MNASDTSPGPYDGLRLLQNEHTGGYTPRVHDGRAALRPDLVRTPDRAPALVAAASMHGVYLRDRSSEPGWAGCVRATTGIVEPTRRCIAVLEEVVCAAR